ncbi:unnamed protein product [Staurois parvus]|uniref:Uncharacterized protein n=1 Tax=Staurois parvus TaxID=386267 RepID=A0ABN9CJ75_9NEOB|nr:unnamed protein product [Staurois parvus]
MMVRDGVIFLCGIPGIQRTGTSLWDGVIFLCGIPGIQRTGTSLWWVPITGSICRKHTH